MDAGTLKLLVAILLFSAPVIFCAEALPKREIAGAENSRMATSSFSVPASMAPTP